MPPPAHCFDPFLGVTNRRVSSFGCQWRIFSAPLEELDTVTMTKSIYGCSNSCFCPPVLRALADAHYTTERIDFFPNLTEKQVMSHVI